MLTVDSIQGYGRFAALAIDEATGDTLIRRTDGVYVTVPRPLVTTPTDRCLECGKEFELRGGGRTNDEFRGVCPDAEHHEYARLWRASRDPKLNRASRRRLQKRADQCLTNHLRAVRGRKHLSIAAAAVSGT
jgi:hypothetical protein